MNNGCVMCYPPVLIQCAHAVAREAMVKARIALIDRQLAELEKTKPIPPKPRPSVPSSYLCQP